MTDVMMRINVILPAGTWDSKREIDQVLIDYDRRFRRRIVLTTVSATEMMLDLPEAIRLRDGDGLATDSGGVICVRAQPEPLLEIHAHRGGELVRIAWHLGNRHLPVQLLGDRIRIREDHVIKAMVEGLGGHVQAIMAPFDPEAGAYAVGSHHHAHDDEDDHRHA
jgi:urease accessory protein